MSIAPNDPNRPPHPDSSENTTTPREDASSDVSKPDDAAGTKTPTGRAMNNTPHGGDKNVVNIGEGAQVDQIAVGRNILQAKVNIGSLVIPVRFLLALLVVAAVGAVVVWSIVVDGTMPEESSLNIAVVDFAEQDAAGNSINQGHGRDLSEWLSKNLASELGKVTRQEPPVVWHVATGFEPIHLFQKRTFAAPVRTADDAQKVIDQFDADVVIYGIVTPGQDSLTFVPQFHINEKTGTQEVPELTGSQQLGKPITLPDPVTIGARETYLEPLGRVIYWLARGVSHDLIGQFETGYRELAEGQDEVAALNEELGTEVYYYFLGTQALFLAQCEQDAHRVFPARPDRSAMDLALDQAEAAYNEAIRIQPAYARAVFGLGQVASLRAQRLMAAADATTFGQCRVANVSSPDPNLPVQCPASPAPTDDPARLEAARELLNESIARHGQALELMKSSTDTLLRSRVKAARATTTVTLATTLLLQGEIQAAEALLQNGVAELETLKDSMDVQVDPRGVATLHLAIGNGLFTQAYTRLIQNDTPGYKNQLEQAVDAFQFCLNIVRDNSEDAYLKDRLAGNCTCILRDAEKALNP